MKLAITLMAATALGVVSAVAAIQPPNPQNAIQPDTKKFMVQKLEYSKAIVEGLTMEDYPQIAKAAQGLMLLSQEADWNVLTTPKYLNSSSEFRETVSRLRDAGDEKNLDGALLAYLEVTLSCVRCHKQLREWAVTNVELDNETQSKE